MSSPTERNQISKIRNSSVYTTNGWSVWSLSLEMINFRSILREAFWICYNSHSCLLLASSPRQLLMTLMGTVMLVGKTDRKQCAFLEDTDRLTRPANMLFSTGASIASVISNIVVFLISVQLKHNLPQGHFPTATTCSSTVIPAVVRSHVGPQTTRCCCCFSIVGQHRPSPM